MWQLYMGNGLIDAQNTYCKANGKLIKEMASRGWIPDLAIVSAVMEAWRDGRVDAPVVEL